MSEDQSFQTVNSMQELFDLIETDNFYPFLSNSPIEQDNELARVEIKRIYAELRTVEYSNFPQSPSFYPVDIKKTNGRGMHVFEDTSGTNTFDDSELSPSSTSSQSSDDYDVEPFNAEEWMIQDRLSYKIRPPKLYEFLRLLLDNPRYISYTSWVNKKEGLFKINKPVQIAYLWKRVKVRKTHGSMDYDTFARGIRYYYQSGAMIKTHTRHTYRFAQI